MEHTSLKLRFHPTVDQALMLSQWFGNCRFVYNWALSLKQEDYKKWVAEGKPKEYNWVNRAELQAALTCKRKELEWLQLTPLTSLQQVLGHLNTGFQSFFNEQTDYPKFKNKSSKQSVHFSNQLVTANHITDTVRLPMGLGFIKPIYSRSLPDGRLLRTVISKEGERYFISFLYEVEDGYSLRQSDKDRLPKCGIDLGVVQPLTVAYKKDGEWRSKVFGIKQREHLTKLEHRRKKYQRSQARKQEAFKKRCRTNKKTGEIIRPSCANLNKAKSKVVRAYQKEKDYRANFAHQVSKALAETFEVIKFEDLKIRNMTRVVRKNEDGSPRINVSAKSGLNREMLRLGLGNVVSLTDYKSKLYGGYLRKVDPAFTSQKCSRCGHTSKLNRKSQAYFECDLCNFVINADENAGRNIYRKRSA